MKAALKDTDVALFAAKERATSTDILGDIGSLGLERKVLELEAHGYTVVRPEEFDDGGLSAALLEAALAMSERKTGQRPDMATGATHSHQRLAGGEQSFYVLLEDPVFEKALLNPAMLALITYLLGESCILSSDSLMIRGPGTPALGLHTDMVTMPSPFPSYSQVANATWALTDYSPEGGSVCFWPGSHKFCRRPEPEEINAREKFVPVTAPAGSLIIWHGNTWHGSFKKQSLGLRINLIMYFCRPYLMPQEDYRGKISAEMVERNGPRFATLLGGDIPYPFSATGPDYVKFGKAIESTARLDG